MKVFRNLLATLLTLCCLSSFAAVVKGSLLDEHKEPLVGAYVMLKELGKHAIVGLDGSFQIDNVPVGSFTVTTSYVGYISKAETIVVSNAGQVLVLNFKLEPDARVLGEVVVRSSAMQGSDLDAKITERNSMSVVNVVSARTIELSPDVTVANVIQRVSGVSITRNNNGDPQYAIVRGMDRRYNYTLVNGVKIPSPDNKNRYIPLDIFPASVLEKLEVSKALTPSMEGDAIGGVVNMVMKDAPERFEAKADVQMGYNQVNLDHTFLQYDHKAVDYKSPYEKYGPLYQAQFANFSKSNLVTKAVQPAPDLLSSFSVGNRFFKDKLGVLVAGGFQNSYRGSSSVWFQTSTDYFGTNSPSLDELHERSYSTQQQRAALHARLDYRLNARNKLKFYVGDYRLLSFQTRDDFVSQLDARYYDATKGNAIVTLATRTRTIDQKIFTTTLQGDHQLNSLFRVNWSAVRSAARNDEPDIAQFERNTGLTNFQLGPITIERHMPRTWQHNSDDDATGYLNSILTPRAIENAEISAGGLYRRKNRVNFYNQYSFDPTPTTQTQGVTFENYEQVTQTVLNPLGSTGNAQNYKAHEYLLDYYLQGKFLLFGHTEVLGGVRVENTNQGYNLTNPVDPSILASLSQKYTDVLPSIAIKHSINERSNLRGNYFKSITRPGYFEIVPYENTAQSDGYPEVGNPNLKRVRAHNFDLRYEFFPNTFDQFLFGVFYKKINDPIEYASVFQSANRVVVQPGNYGTAYNWGIEADLTKFFNQFGIKLNYTFTDSRITTEKALRTREDPNDVTSQIIVRNIAQTRPLQGQAKHLGNLSLLYKNQRSGTDVQLAAVYTGENIESVSPFLENDSWVKPFVQVALSVEQKIGKRFVISLKGQNLLNSPYEVYIKKPHLMPDKDYKLQNSATTTLIRRDLYYQSYRIGIRVNI